MVNVDWTQRLKHHLIDLKCEIFKCEIFKCEIFKCEIFKCEIVLRGIVVKPLVTVDQSCCVSALTRKESGATT